jgi:endonuclease/exonuclease/phosphatase family metal-dependent hydrolase
MLLSKYPIGASGKGRIDGELPVLVWGEIKPMPQAPPVTIAVTHLAWPFKKIRAPIEPTGAEPTLNQQRQSLPKGLPRLVQTEQALNLTGALDRLSSNLVLMGDFNMAPWSRTQQYLRRATGLDNKGDLVPSWPSWAPAFMRLPIDHVMTRGNPQILSLSAGPDVGSDHRPVEAVIAVTLP